MTLLNWGKTIGDAKELMSCGAYGQLSVYVAGTNSTSSHHKVVASFKFAHLTLLRCTSHLHEHIIYGAFHPGQDNISEIICYSFFISLIQWQHVKLTNHFNKNTKVIFLYKRVTAIISTKHVIHRSSAENYPLTKEMYYVTILIKTNLFTTCNTIVWFKKNVYAKLEPQAKMHLQLYFSGGRSVVVV
jgi:hypothetical protein